MTTPGQQPAPVPAYPVAPPPPEGDEVEGPPSSSVERLVFFAICLVVGATAALPAGWLWVALADPPSTRLTTSGLEFGELAFDHVSAITFWFVAVGFAFGLVLGLVAALLGRRHGIVTVLAILVMCWIGTTLTLWCGVHLFGPDHPVDFVALFDATPKERTQTLSSFENGDLLVSSLKLTTWVGLLGWPVGGMVGALVGAFWWPKAPKSPWMPPA